jgi:hypothetical protein
MSDQNQVITKNLSTVRLNGTRVERLKSIDAVKLESKWMQDAVIPPDKSAQKR